MDRALETTDLTVRFGKVVALPPVTISVAQHEAVAIMGPSGSGKTTLLSVIEGMTKPTTGHITVLDTDLYKRTRNQRAALRRRSMGLIFQDASLLPELSVQENVALTLLFDGEKRPAALARAREALADVGLAERVDAQIPTLSGGEAQRVAVARALVRPDVHLVIADEPTASLDAASAMLVTEVLLATARAQGATVILATHDPKVADQCDRTIHLDALAAAA